MDRDSLDVMPAASRREVIAAVRGVLEVDAATAETWFVRRSRCGTRWSELGGSSTPGAEASSATGFRASWRLSGHVRSTPDYSSAGQASTARKPQGLSHTKRSQSVA